MCPTFHLTSDKQPISLLSLVGLARKTQLWRDITFKKPSLGLVEYKGHAWESLSMDPYGLWVLFPVTFLWRLCICPVHLHSPGANCCLLDPATVYRDHMLSLTLPRLWCATWPCCPQIRTCCCLTTTAGNVLPWRAYRVETQVELWHSRQARGISGSPGGSSWQLRASHVLLDMDFAFRVDSEASHDTSSEESIV